MKWTVKISLYRETCAHHFNMADPLTEFADRIFFNVPVRISDYLQLISRDKEEMLFGKRDFVFRGKITDDRLYDSIELPHGTDNTAKIPAKCLNLYELEYSREILTKEINEIMALIDKIPDEELNDVELDIEKLRAENAAVDDELRLQIEKCEAVRDNLKKNFEDIINKECGISNAS